MGSRSTTLAGSPHAMWERYSRLSTSRKVILVVFLIWLAQALPKWTAAITADGELSAKIMKVFVTPRAERFDAQRQEIPTQTAANQ